MTGGKKVTTHIADRLRLPLHRRVAFAEASGVVGRNDFRVRGPLVHEVHGEVRS